MDGALTLLDLGIDEEAIRQQPTDYILIKKWLGEFFKSARGKLCGEKSKTNIGQQDRYKTGEEKPKNTFLIKKMF